MVLKSSGYNQINGKDVFLVDLAANNLPGKRSDIKEALMGKSILIDDRPAEVIGIELFATPEDADHKEIGLMVKLC